jgi:hypothetical protein
LASTASAAAVQNRSPALRPSASPARQLSNALNATRISMHSVASICVVRDLSKNIHIVASIAAASTATRSPARRRPSRIVSTSAISAASTEGSRAVTLVTAPSGSDTTAMSQKNSGGLSVVITPLTCGTAHSPSTIISLAPSAKYCSSGGARS